MEEYKLLGGKHRDAHGKIYVAGDILMLSPTSAKALGSRVELVDKSVDVEVQEKEKIAPPEEILLKAVHRGGGRWNVINQATGQPINDDYLTKQEAKELVDGESQMERPEDLEEPDSLPIRRRSKPE